MAILRRLLQPAWLTVIPALVSFAVWIVPWSTSVRRGFDHSTTLTAGSGAFLIAWYGTLGLAGFIGWQLGRSQEPSARLDSADGDRVYRLLTVMSVVGVGGMYAVVEVTAPGLIERALAEHQFNLVREAVPASAGISTLRYASILSGAIAIHGLLVLKERRRALHWLNLLLLLANSFVASRLALIMALLCFVGLSTRPGAARSVRLSARQAVLALTLAVVALGAANYVRNANFYEARGVTNPVSMTLGEFVTYIGSPTQVAVATGGIGPPPALDTGEAVKWVLVPTFFSGPVPPDVARSGDWYRGSVDLEASLTTNSSVAFLQGALGWAAWPLMLLVTTSFSYVGGRCSRYKSEMYLGAFVVTYCFAELWRTYLFNTGIVWFLLIALYICCFFGARQKVEV